MSGSVYPSVHRPVNSHYVLCDFSALIFLDLKKYFNNRVSAGHSLVSLEINTTTYGHISLIFTSSYALFLAECANFSLSENQFYYQLGAIPDEQK